MGMGGRWLKCDGGGRFRGKSPALTLDIRSNQIVHNGSREGHAPVVGTVVVVEVVMCRVPLTLT
jgi:hypothetical protein